ncbi:MAG: prealbumin-like fold domain-containing protein [Solirubrobacteraceae bacterium]
MQTDPAGDSTAFPFHIDFAAHPGDPGPYSPQPPSDLTVTAGSPATFDVHKGFYTVTSQTPAGYKLVDITCVADPPDSSGPDTFLIDVPNSQVRIELSGQESKTCTFKLRKQPVLKIVKRTDPAGSAGSFAFHPGTSLAAPDFTLGDGQSSQFVLDPGTYDVTEQALAGWTLKSAACDDSDSTVSGSTATAVLAAGEVVTCTFTNAPTPAAPPVPPAAAVKPTQAVSPAHVRRGVAALIAPRGCVVNRYTVAVVGGPVRSVSWYVNGHRVRITRPRRTNQRRFTVLLRPVPRIQMITARVLFASDARPRTRVLHATIRRCAAKRVKPKFTG